ncbi:MAG: hypothetical protein PHQ86_09205 [Dehalococcoidales bacterium]|nr:hypothetical protein [Dehalococcoidales bacterium]
MENMVNFTKRMIRRGMERDRSNERYVKAISKHLWPWQESKLIGLVSLLVILDYLSTYAFLKLSGKTNVFESSPLASWALQTGGFFKLFWVDIVSIFILLLVAITLRYLINKLGFNIFARTAFVIVLIPYVVITIAAIFNNIVLTFI